MNKLFLALVVLLSTSAMTADAPAEAKYYKKRVNHRQVAQKKRIGHGIKSGELTGKEAKRLSKQQAALARKEHQMRLSGDGLSKGEAARLERAQDQLSRSIYKQKHDGQDRN